MSVKRTIIFGAVGGAIVVWLAAAATSPTRTAAPMAPPKTDTADRSGAELAAEVARLHERLRPVDTPLQSRNLFRYSVMARRLEPAPPQAPIVLDQQSPPAVIASPLKLVGIAEDAGDGAAIRTAIISGFGELFLVKEGDAVTLRYRVSHVSADAVELVDVGDLTPLRLALR